MFGENGIRFGAGSAGGYDERDESALTSATEVKKMHPHPHSPTEPHRSPGEPRPTGLLPGLLNRWLVAGSLLSGFLALVWLLLRSGTKPSRLTYPCQQAAFSTASLSFGVPVVLALIAVRRRLVGWLHARWGIAVAALGLFATLGVGGYLSQAGADSGPRAEPPREYRAQLYRVVDCPQDPLGERFLGVENLLAHMGQHGLKFYKSETVSLLSGPDGIIAADDTVVVKINYQWDQRGGTNTDVLRGLIRCLVDHPDTFTGEVVVCENAQFNSTANFDRAENNAQDHGLSPHDVVLWYQSQGYTVGQYDWTLRRDTQVNEYSAGDPNDGYIVLAYDPQFQGRISYPKFMTSYGTRLSLKFGIWDPGTSTYDRAHLKFINLPVLKSHHATYGVTACIKHYMGVVSGNLNTNSHSAIARGIMGALLCHIQPADLNILDCIWINANPYSGPSTPYSGATRRDQLVASQDPVALDIWATKNILIPAFIANGYSPPWPEPSADPDLPSSDFRIYLDKSMAFLILGGYSVTNNYSRIDAYTASGAMGNGDYNGDGLVDAVDLPYFAGCMAGPSTTPAPPDPVTPDECLWTFDFDGDGDVDLQDYAAFAERVGEND